MPEHIHRHACWTCGRVFANRSHATRYCCLEHRTRDVQARQERHRRNVAVVRRSLMAIFRKIEQNRARPCGSCGVGFYPRWGQEYCAEHREDRSRKGPFPHTCVQCERGFASPSPIAKFCSDRCRGRSNRQRHRPDEKRMLTLRPRVLARDGLLCYLCCQTIDQELNYLHPEALTLDHVIPRANGGPTTIENLRPAHRRCNSNKRDALLPDFLLERQSKQEVRERLSSIPWYEAKHPVRDLAGS